MSSIEWFKGYTDKFPRFSMSCAQLYSKIRSTLEFKSAEKVIKNQQNISNENYSMALNQYNVCSNIIKNKSFNKWEVSSKVGTLVDNKNIVFILIDNGVASSGETFVRNLRTLKNVIFVGTNTYGCSLIPNNFFYKLPDSGIILYFGTGLFFTPGFEEGTGYMPDIWVNSNDALDRVIKLIENNKK